MVRKKTIGKVQLAIGIIVLLVGIFGLVYSYNNLGWAIDISGPNYDIEEAKSYSNETQAMLRMDSLSLNVMMSSTKILSVFFLASTSIILIILSLMFITQGLLNKSGNQNGV